MMLTVLCIFGCTPDKMDTGVWADLVDNIDHDTIE